MSRHRIHLNIKEDWVVKGEELKQVIYTDPKLVGATKAWVHFKNEKGLILCCRRFPVAYKALDDVFKVRNAQPITLKKSLLDVAKRAQTCCSKEGGNDKLTVTLRDGTLTVTSGGASRRGQRLWSMRGRHSASASVLNSSPTLWNDTRSAW